MSSPFEKFFFEPHMPNIAAGIVDGNFVVVSLRRTRAGIELSSSALTSVPDEVLVPSFDSPNVQDMTQLVQIITQTAEAAGLGNKRRWSAVVPDNAIRTVIVTVEGKPANRQELNEMISWKTERSIGTPSSELRISKQKLTRVAGQDRYLVAAARETILQEYESAFAAAGWQTGLLLPKYLGETQWLISADPKTPKMLVSSNSNGFTSVVIKNGEVVLVRSHECDLGSVSDELYRVALYYRDRIASDDTRPESGAIEKLLVVGAIDRGLAIKAVTEATGRDAQIVDASYLGLDLSGEPVSFDQLAGVAGLCTLAWA